MVREVYNKGVGFVTRLRETNMPSKKEALWARIAVRYPGGVTLTPAGTRQFFDAVYDAGVASGQTASSSLFDDLLQSMSQTQTSSRR